jgi:hypothetical protein
LAFDPARKRPGPARLASGGETAGRTRRLRLADSSINGAQMREIPISEVMKS